MLVTEPQLHCSIRPGGGEGAGGQDSVRSHSVSSTGLRWHESVDTMLSSGSVVVVLEHCSSSLDQVPPECRGHHHDGWWWQCCDAPETDPCTLNTVHQWEMKISCCTPGSAPRTTHWNMSASVQLSFTATTSLLTSALLLTPLSSQEMLCWQWTSQKYFISLASCLRDAVALPCVYDRKKLVSQFPSSTAFQYWSLRQRSHDTRPSGGGGGGWLHNKYRALHFSAVQQSKFLLS